MSSCKVKKISYVTSPKSKVPGANWGAIFFACQAFLPESVLVYGMNASKTLYNDDLASLYPESVIKLKSVDIYQGIPSVNRREAT